jgi:hypothetical protein
MSQNKIWPATRKHQEERKVESWKQMENFSSTDPYKRDTKIENEMAAL